MKFATQSPLAVAEQERRLSAPLTSNDGFTLEKREPTRVKGFDIRIQRDGSSWMNQQAHAWMTGDTLPAEWVAIVNDPTVVRACMFPSSQRSWRADRRRNVAEYQRQAVAV